jgi:hypothetical protein
VGGRLVVVQTGDEIDRGDDDREILDHVEEGERQAAAEGGELVALLGNHEIMNAALDLTRRLLSGTVRGVQSRVRVWAEGSKLPPWAFTRLCVHFVAPSTRPRAPRRARIPPQAPGGLCRRAERMLGVPRPDASGIRRFFASLYSCAPRARAPSASLP